MMLGKIYGVFEVRVELSDKPLVYGCVCIKCGVKKRFKVKVLKKLKKKKCPKCKSKPSKILTIGTLKSPPKVETSEITPASEVMALINSGDIKGGALSSRQNAIAVLLELLPLAEEAYKDSQQQHAAYAYTNLLSQLNELIETLEGADSDEIKDGLSSSIIGIIHSEFLQIGQGLVNVSYNFQSTLVSSIPEERRQMAITETNLMTKQLAQLMEKGFSDMRSRILTKITETNL